MRMFVARHLVGSGLIDISVLVHLVEQVAREVILSARASTPNPTLCAGFSGLLVPVSWAVSLSVHVKQARVFRLLWLNKLPGCIKLVLARLSNSTVGLCLTSRTVVCSFNLSPHFSGHPKPVNNESHKPTIEFLGVRL